jgi:hypothetical protein
MSRAPFTLLDEGRAVEVPASASGDGVRIAPDDLRAALGWELKPQGLCLADRCVPVRPTSGIVHHDGVDLAAFAAAVERPLALDTAERVAYLGASAGERAERLASLEAPDFTLPDFDGRPHTLSAFRGTKVLLVAYASW